MTTRDYELTVTPDLMLFLAGYDSSFGFVGGGLVQMSDYLGDHRFGIAGDTVPGVDTGVDASYEFSQWRTTVDLNYFYYQNYYNLYDPQTGQITAAYHNNANGFTLNFSYPIDTSTRVEYGLGTERFLGSPLYLQFSEGISNYNLNEQWTVANFYRLALVQDKRQGTQFWPSSGYGLNLTLLHAVPVLDSNVSFANLLFETDVFADFGFLNHLVWANRLVAMTSQGPNPQTFFVGDDNVGNSLLGGYFTTLRGYGGATYFGSNIGLYNTELRYPIATNMDFTPQPLSFLLVKDVELAGFMDAGILSNQVQELADSPVLASIGTGIRFYTFFDQRALVMLRFDVAWPLTQSGPPEFDFNLAPMF
jgi:outer membrane protein assembly factor BamA